jgi:DNA-binding MarR family transcriptional regulator
MIIDLFIAFETGERLYVKDLILKSGESAASAMRRIDRLQQAALLTRHPDPFDQRRVYVGITDKGRAAMTSMLNHLFDADKMVGEGIAVKPRSYGPDPHPIR